MTLTKPKKSLLAPVYASAGANRSPHCAAWSADGTVLLYGACAAVAVVDTTEVRQKTEVWQVCFP